MHWSHIHTCTHSYTDTELGRQPGDKCLAQEHIEMWQKGAGIEDNYSTYWAEVTSILCFHIWLAYMLHISLINTQQWFELWLRLFLLPTTGVPLMACLCTRIICTLLSNNMPYESNTEGWDTLNKATLVYQWVNLAAVNTFRAYHAYRWCSAWAWGLFWVKHWGEPAWEYVVNKWVWCTEYNLTFLFYLKYPSFILDKQAEEPAPPHTPC